MTIDLQDLSGTFTVFDVVASLALSFVLAAIIGWVFLKETVGPRRVFLMALIALGAVIVEAGG